MRSSKLKLAAAILSCIVIGTSCIACSSEQKNDSGKKPTSSQTQTQTQKPSSSQNQTADKNNSASTQTPSSQDKVDSGTATPPSGNNISSDAYNEKINYYMTLVETLQGEILELKQQNYIEVSEYKAKVSELERNVSLLLDRIETLASGGNTIKPVDPNENLSGGSGGSSFDNISKKSSFEYTVNDGKATITRYIGSEADVIIPRTIDNYTVCAIGESAFQNCDIESVVIPDSVRLIDWFAFSGCTSLQSVTVPSSVMSVEYGAFDYCPRSMKIICTKGSYIEAYALSWGMMVVAN